MEKNGNDRIGNGNDEAFFLIQLAISVIKWAIFIAETDDDDWR